MANIYIRKDEVYRTRVEDVTDRTQFFYPVYEQARDCLKTMVDYTNRFWQEREGIVDDQDKEDNFNPIRLRGYPNNIIAFNADRGHGKTSAMLSFSTALQAICSRSTTDRNDRTCKDKDFWPSDMRCLRFFALEPIDPTVLENKDPIIPVIISRMFTYFTDHARELRNPPSAQLRQYEHRDIAYTHQNLRDQQQTLLQMFQDCYRLADDHKDKKGRSENYDDLQVLADRGDSSNFKERFAQLVFSYLQFMCLEPNNSTVGRNRDAYLIIQIDDADMNPEHAYDVVEDIRKYCVLPNVIILFATNMKQLEMCVEQHFIKSFDTVIKTTVKDDPESLHTAAHSHQQCHRTAVNYLDKLVPSLHRINLPNINNELQNYGNRVGLYHNGLHEHEQKENPEPYQVTISNLVARKCLLEIQSQENRLHPFLPRQMRELTHFLNRLMTMEDVMLDGDTKKRVSNPRRELMKWAIGVPNTKDYTKDAQNLKKNLEALMDYLVYDWGELSLKSWQQDTLQEIHRASAECKVAAALEAIDQKFLRYQNNYSNRNSAYTWDELLNKITLFHNKQDLEFSSALELYFEMYKELLSVCDCISRRGGRA